MTTSMTRCSERKEQEPKHNHGQQITRQQKRQQRRRCNIMFGLACVLIIPCRCLRTIVIFWQVKTNNNSIIESASLLPARVIQESQQKQEQQHNSENNDEEEVECSGSGRTITRRKIPFNVRTDLKLRPFLAVVDKERKKQSGNSNHGKSDNGTTAAGGGNHTGNNNNDEESSSSENSSTPSSRKNHRPVQQQKRRQPLKLPRTTHRCVQGAGRGDRRRHDYYRASEWQRRTCYYENLYFHPATETFYYYYYGNDDDDDDGKNKKRNKRKTNVNKIYNDYYTASGYLVAEKRPSKWVGKFHMFVPVLTDGDGDQGGQRPPVVPLRLQTNKNLKIRPNTVAAVEEPTPGDTDPVFVLYKPSYDFNFGHFLIDDVYSVFTMLDFFGYTTTTTTGAATTTRGKNSRRCNDDGFSGRHYQHIPVHLEQHHGEVPDPFYRCRKDNPESSGRWLACAKMLKRVMAGLMGIRPEIQNITTTTITTTTATTNSSSGPNSRKQQSSVLEDVDIARTSNLFGPHDDGGGSGSGDPDGSDSITSSTAQQHDQYLVSLPEGTELVLLPAVIAGPGHLAAASCAGECVLHRASQMERFRNWMFHNVFEGNKKAPWLGRNTRMNTASILGQSSLAPPSVTASSPNLIPATAGVSGRQHDDILITVSLAVGNSHGPEYICPFEARIVPALERHFRQSDHRVKLTAVDMASLSLQKQVDVVASSAVYITNQGGGAATILFLRKGATAVLFYNSTTKDKKFPIESNLYGAAGGYINVEWADKNDYCVNSGDERAIRDFVHLVEDLLHSNRQIQQQLEQ